MVLFQIIQFILSHLCLQLKCQIYLFDLYIGPDQVPPLKAWVNLGVMAMKGYSAFPRFQHYWGLIIRWFNVITRTFMGYSLSPLQRCSQCILQPQLTGLFSSRVFFLFN